MITGKIHIETKYDTSISQKLTDCVVVLYEIQAHHKILDRESMWTGRSPWDLFQRDLSIWNSQQTVQLSEKLETQPSKEAADEKR